MKVMVMVMFCVSWSQDDVLQFVFFEGIEEALRHFLFLRSMSPLTYVSLSFDVKYAEGGVSGVI